MQVLFNFRAEGTVFALSGTARARWPVTDFPRRDTWRPRLSYHPGVVKQSDIEASNEALAAVCQAMADMVPADPIEGMLIAQLVAANEAALTLYRKGWQNVNVPEYFEGGTKFLQLADKAARTVVLLTERLDHHRGRGQQQITVKHVTTNNVTADQQSSPIASPRAVALATSHLPPSWPPALRHLCQFSTR